MHYQRTIFYNNKKNIFHFNDYYVCFVKFYRQIKHFFKNLYKLLVNMQFLMSNIFFKLLSNVSEYLISKIFEIIIIIAVNIINLQTGISTTSSIIKFNLLISYFGIKFKKN